MPIIRGRAHRRPHGRATSVVEQSPGSTVETAGYLWVLIVAALALCAAILVISLNAVTTDAPFYSRFQFAASLQRYTTAPSAQRLELRPNLCMIRHAPACGTPVPMTTRTLPPCQVSCDGEGVCKCKYMDEFPAYPLEVLTGQNCSRAVAALLE